jgi:hypothetical protein
MVRVHSTGANANCGAYGWPKTISDGLCGMLDMLKADTLPSGLRNPAGVVIPRCSML